MESEASTCGHCGVKYAAAHSYRHLGEDGEQLRWRLDFATCPICKGVNFRFVTFLKRAGEAGEGTEEVRIRWPRLTGCPVCPPEVPRDLAADYDQACLVLPDSPRASAALSRRCLQALLREHGFDQKDLAVQIDKLLASGSLPTYIAETVDAVRAHGNFAAHPLKSQSTGLIVEVEPGEAEWNIEVLVSLFDFYYVLPAKTQTRLDALNEKLLDAGKPELKRPTE